MGLELSHLKEPEREGGRALVLILQIGEEWRGEEGVLHRGVVRAGRTRQQQDRHCWRGPCLCRSAAWRRAPFSPSGTGLFFADL